MFFIVFIIKSFKEKNGNDVNKYTGVHTWVAMQQSAKIIAIKYIISSKITAKTDFFFFKLHSTIPYSTCVLLTMEALRWRSYK